LRYGFDAVNLNFLVLDGISDGNGIELARNYNQWQFESMSYFLAHPFLAQIAQ
jgi:hypothetical protein